MPGLISTYFKYFILWVGGPLTCMSVRLMHTMTIAMRVHQILWYELPCGCSEMNPDPLEEQALLLTVEPPLISLPFNLRQGAM